jgi:hypothetical protein
VVHCATDAFRGLQSVRGAIYNAGFALAAQVMQVLGEWFEKIAGVAQLVERNLAKVEVESSRLFSRSSS